MKQKSMTLAIVASLAAIAMVGELSAAATLSYSYYTASSDTDTSWVNVSGYSSIVAGNAGGGETSYGGVTWQSMPGGNVQTSASGVTINFSAPSVAWAATYNAYYTIGSTPALLTDGAYSDLQNNGTDFLLTISGLTVDVDYLIQFVMADTRGGAADSHTTILAKGSDVTGDSARTLNGYTDGRYLVITAAFTAETDTAIFQPGQAYSDVAPTATFVSGVQVLAAVPEPSAALLGGLGIFGLLRRRRA